MADLSKYKAVDMEFSVRTSNMIRHLWGDQITLSDLNDMSHEELTKSFGARSRKEILEVINNVKAWADPEPTRDQRIADLLEANNRYLQRARDAEAKVAAMTAQRDAVQAEVEALRGAVEESLKDMEALYDFSAIGLDCAYPDVVDTPSWGKGVNSGWDAAINRCRKIVSTRAAREGRSALADQGEEG